MKFSYACTCKLFKNRRDPPFLNPGLFAKYRSLNLTERYNTILLDNFSRWLKLIEQSIDYLETGSEF